MAINELIREDHGILRTIDNTEDLPSPARKSRQSLAGGALSGRRAKHPDQIEDFRSMEDRNAPTLCGAEI